jgi:hypothetical protein
MEIARAEFRNHFHACAFVTGPDEERSIVEPFLVEGMKRGERACYIVDPDKHAAHDAALRRVAPNEELVEVSTWHENHLKGGSFDAERMKVALEELMRDNANSGRPPMRIVGQMGWVFSRPPGIEDLVAYEATVTEQLNRGKSPTICVYDVRRLTGALMMDLLRAHPITIMNGMLHENPFYTPADEMLREIRARGAHGGAH